MKENIKIEFAKKSDDKDLRKLMKEITIPGNFQISYQREPSFFDALAVEGYYSHVVVARKTVNNEIIGLGVRSVKQLYINGIEKKIGYLSSLRLSENYRNGFLIAKGYKLFYQLHCKDKVDFYLSTIINDNTAAINILTKPGSILPNYYDFGQYRSSAIVLNQKIRNNKIGIIIRRGKPDDLSAIITFLNSEGKKKQFFPAYKITDFSDNGLLKNLNPENILLAFSGKELVGVIAAWDQNSFRQSVMTDYSKKIVAARSLYNLFSPILRLPKIPRKGGELNYFYAGLICIKNNDCEIFSLLLNRIMEENKSKYSFLMIGMHEKDLLLKEVVKLKSIKYLSRMYIVSHEKYDFKEMLDSKIPYLELGAL